MFTARYYNPIMTIRESYITLENRYYLLYLEKKKILGRGAIYGVMTNA